VEPPALDRGAADCVWMTCVGDGREHAISDSDFAAGVATGLYRAVCDRVVMPRALAAPCGPRCLRCVASLEPSRAGGSVGGGSSRTRPDGHRIRLGRSRLADLGLAAGVRIGRATMRPR